MSSKTFKVIALFVSLLFINIEAAQAGLVHKFKRIILNEFPDYQIVYLTIAVFFVGFIIYVMFAPVRIGNQKSIWLDYFPSKSNLNDYQNKRAQVKKISIILNNPSQG
jgi:hypothetical protein